MFIIEHTVVRKARRLRRDVISPRRAPKPVVQRGSVRPVKRDKDEKALYTFRCLKNRQPGRTSFTRLASLSEYIVGGLVMSRGAESTFQRGRPQLMHRDDGLFASTSVNCGHQRLGRLIVFMSL